MWNDGATVCAEVREQISHHPLDSRYLTLAFSFRFKLLYPLIHLSISHLVGKRHLGPHQYLAYGCALPHSFRLIKKKNLFLYQMHNECRCQPSGALWARKMIEDPCMYKLRRKGSNLTSRNHKFSFDFSFQNRIQNSANICGTNLLWIRPYVGLFQPPADPEESPPSALQSWLLTLCPLLELIT